MNKNHKITITVIITVSVLAPLSNAYAMHISEGILPLNWAFLWYVLAIPFIVLGIRDIQTRGKNSAHFKLLVGLVGAAVFIISCMPIPVPTAGTCSHPCGTGIAAVLVGPYIAVLITSIALLLQALFMAHGGLTTLGANTFAMGVVGAFSGYGVFKLSEMGARKWGHITSTYPHFPVAGAFLAGLVSDWATYATTSFILTCGLHQPGHFEGMFIAILVAFIPTQVPLGILEGFVSAGAYKFVLARRPELLKSLALRGAK